MAKSDEDLNYVIGFEPDTKNVDSFLGSLASKVASVGGGVTKMLGGLLGNASGGGGIGSSIGGIAGEALGGPVGAAIGGAAGGMADKVLAPIGKVFSAITNPVETLGGALQELQGPLGAVGLVLPDALKSVVGSLTSMAAKASPATFMMFEQAVDDTQAVIGRAFIPVLEMMREGVVLFGDTLATILPDAGEVSVALSTLREAFAETGHYIREALGEVGPAIRTGLIVGLRLLGDALAWVTRQIGPMVVGLLTMFRPLREMLGITERGTRGQTGAASQPAQFSSIDEYQRQLQLAAFSVGGGPTQADLPVLVSNIERILTDIYNYFQTFTMEKFVTELANAILGPNRAGSTEQAVANRISQQGSGESILAALTGRNIQDIMNARDIDRYKESGR